MDGIPMKMEMACWIFSTAVTRSPGLRRISAARCLMTGTGMACPMQMTFAPTVLGLPRTMAARMPRFQHSIFFSGEPSSLN
jgi:hypothetical protein